MLGFDEGNGGEVREEGPFGEDIFVTEWNHGNLFFYYQRFTRLNYRSIILIIPSKIRLLIAVKMERQMFFCFLQILSFNTPE